MLSCLSAPQASSCLRRSTQVPWWRWRATRWPGSSGSSSRTNSSSRTWRWTCTGERSPPETIQEPENLEICECCCCFFSYSATSHRIWLEHLSQIFVLLEFLGVNMWRISLQFVVTIVCSLRVHTEQWLSRTWTIIQSSSRFTLLTDDKLMPGRFWSRLSNIFYSMRTLDLNIDAWRCLFFFLQAELVFLFFHFPFFFFWPFKVAPVESCRLWSFTVCNTVVQLLTGVIKTSFGRNKRLLISRKKH